MKNIVLPIIFIGISLNMYGQIQKNFAVDQKHVVNVNLTQVNDGSNDIVIASNLFDAGMQVHELSLKRLNSSNSVVWSNTYEGTALSRARVFDIENYYDFIFIAGTVEDQGMKKAFVARIEAFSGNVLDAKYYEIHDPMFNSTALKIIATESDATGDGNPDPGILVTGYFSVCNIASTICLMNMGFALRTDLNLDVLWAYELSSYVLQTNFDYDFVNGVVETSDGFFLTGSVTGETSLGMIRQAVLAHKIDFEGNFVWDNSYIFGNSNDLSVDAFFDPTSDEIYLLTNYSNIHNFAVTVLENSSGAVVPAKTWYATSPDMDMYGFNILRSLSDPDNLIITGYMREHNYSPTLHQTNTFIYEFNKNTTLQVGSSYLYNVYHHSVTGDEYDFWSFQMPLIYYPDMGLINFDGTNTYYSLLGYRTNADGFTEAELFKSTASKVNACDNEPLQFNVSLQTNLEHISSITSGSTLYTETALNLTTNPVVVIEGMCSPTVSAEITDYNNLINIYPNPVENYLYIDGENISSVEIINYLGQVIIRNSNPVSNSIDLTDLPKGYYIVNVYLENNLKETFKILKQ